VFEHSGKYFAKHEKFNFSQSYDEEFTEAFIYDAETRYFQNVRPLAKQVRPASD